MKRTSCHRFIIFNIRSANPEGNCRGDEIDGVRIGRASARDCPYPDISPSLRTGRVPFGLIFWCYAIWKAWRGAILAVALAACEDLTRRCNVWVEAIPCGCPVAGVLKRMP